MQESWIGEGKKKLQLPLKPKLHKINIHWLEPYAKLYTSQILCYPSLIMWNWTCLKQETIFF